MTLLSVVQNAAIRCLGKKPSTVFSANDTESLQFQYLANEVARDIAKSQDWQALIQVHLITGDGETKAFPMPADYDRMLVDGALYDALNWAWGYKRIVNPSDWLQYEIYDWQLIVPGAWTILGGEFKFVPAPYDGAQAKFVYISNNIVRDSDGNAKPAFTKDSDTFIIDERLLTLGIIWKWREMEGMDSTLAQANFEKAFNEISGRDKGARILVVGNYWRDRFDTKLAYPWPLGS